MKTNFCISVYTAFIIAALGSSAFSQDKSYTHQPLSKEDSSAINALVLYPDTIRIDIFEACEYPAAIVNIASIQKNSSSEFAKTLSGYTKDEQEDWWDLGRYPDLISKLVQGGKKSEQEINVITAGYPDDVRKTALKYGRNDYAVLKQIDDQQKQANAQFEQTIADYPPVTQDAFRELLGFPEIMNLLNDHLNLAVRVGDRYKRDPQRVIHRADSMNLVIVRQRAEEANAWKDSLQQNPDEANDLKNAANEYAQENGYTQDEINSRPDPYYINNYVCYPYSYWFGYPSWYPYYYWYPYPFWFDCGFYYDAFGNIIIIGMPSFYFTNWYFYYPNHWHNYPHLCDGFIRHYYGPRSIVNSNALVVRSWVNDNSRYLPHDFITNPSKRVEAIRQVGQLNMDAIKGKGSRTVSPAVRDQYFQKNPEKYPALNPASEPRMQPDAKQQNMLDIREQPSKQPAVRMQKPEVQPVETPKPEAKPRDYKFNNIQPAQDYHRNTWEQAQPAPRPQPEPRQQSQPQPPPRQQQPQPNISRPQQPTPSPAPQPPGKKK